MPAWRGWLAFGLGTALFFYAFLHRVAPSVMVDELMRDFAVSGAILGNLSAIYFYLYAGLQFPIGVLTARFGPRRLMTAAALVAAVGAVVFATAGDALTAGIGRALIGGGSAFAWVGTLALATRYLPADRFALLTGVLQAVGMIGGIAGQAPLGLAVDAFGWRDTVLMLGAVGLVLAGAIWLVAENEDSASGRPAIWAALARVAGSRQSWILCAVGLTMAAPMLAFAALWGIPFLMSVYGLERALAAAVFSGNFLGWAIGAPLHGYLSDRLRRRKPFLVVGAAVSLASIAIVVYVPALPIWLLAAMMFVNGLAASALVVTYATARESNAPAVSSAVYGMINAAVTGSGALFQPLIGWLLDLGWDGRLVDGARIYSADAYAGALAVLPAAGAVGLLLALAVRETHARQTVA